MSEPKEKSSGNLSIILSLNKIVIKLFAKDLRIQDYFVSIYSLTEGNSSILNHLFEGHLTEPLSKKRV